MGWTGVVGAISRLDFLSAPVFSFMRISGNGLRGSGGWGRNLCFGSESLEVGGNSQGSRSDPVGWSENSLFLGFTTLSDLALGCRVLGERKRRI